MKCKLWKVYTLGLCLDTFEMKAWEKRTSEQCEDTLQLVSFEEWVDWASVRTFLLCEVWKICAGGVCENTLKSV